MDEQSKQEWYLVRKLLAPERLWISDRAPSTKWDAIAWLTDCLVQVGDLNPEERDAALQAVTERERRASTGLGRGLAVPHGVYEPLCREIGVLGIFPQGIDFGSHDGRPAHLVLLLLYPSRAREEHLANVAAAARLLGTPVVVEKLITVQDAAEAYQLLEWQAAHGN